MSSPLIPTPDTRAAFLGRPGNGSLCECCVSRDWVIIISVADTAHRVPDMATYLCDPCADHTLAAMRH